MIFGAMMIFFTNILLATPSAIPSIEVAPIGVSKKIKVVLRDLKQATKIELTTENGSVLISEQTNSPSFAKLYNLELLSEGNYILRILNAQREIEQPIEINRNEVLVNVLSRRDFFLPTVFLDQKIVNVMLLNQRLTDVTVMLKDAYGDILFTEKIGAVFKLEKRYDIAALDRGNYQVVIATSEKTYYHDIRKK